MAIKLTKELLEQLYFNEGKSITKIAKEFDITVSSVWHYFKKFEIKSKGPGQSIKNLIGKRFGRLIVLERVRSNTDSAKWKCLCDCGNIKEIVSPSLIQGSTTSCGCLSLEVKYKGYKNLSGSFWNSIKNGAISRNLEFLISIEYVWDLYIKQDKKCALSGVDIILERNYTTRRYIQTASLDRIDSSQGYIIDNVQWLHKDLNMLKHKHSTEFLLYWTKLIYKHSISRRKAND